MGKCKKDYAIIVSILIIAFLLTGCGNIPQPALDTIEHDEADATAIYYSLTETKLPDCQRALSDSGLLLNDNWFAKKLVFDFIDGQLYCMSQLSERLEEQNEIYFPKGTVIQILEAPYQEWQNYYIPSDIWREGDSFDVASIVEIQETGVLLILRYNQTEELYLGYYDWNGQGELWGKLSEDPGNAVWYYEGGQLYAFTNLGKEMTVFDAEYQAGTRLELEYSVQGSMKGSTGEGRIWYGYDQDGILVWDRLRGDVKARILDGPNRFSFQMGMTSEGKLVLADEQTAWLYAEDSQELFNFYEQDYVIEELLGINVSENGEMQFWASYEEGLYLLTAHEEKRSVEENKQEIVLALPSENIFMQKMVASYNRKSRYYHISLRYPDAGETLTDFSQQIQLELSAGGGPDLLADLIVDIEGAVAQGYLQSLEGIVEDKSSFVSVAFEKGVIEGTTYGIPYNCGCILLVVPEEIGQGRTHWTFAEMESAIRDSTALMLSQGIDGTAIVMLCGLYDESSKSYIDWEKGESHLTEQSFLDLLAFAKEYADNQSYKSDEIGSMLQAGQIAGSDVFVYAAGQMDYAQACFGRETNYIGYPREEGKGVYMYSENLYMNQASDNREGVEDFLGYLLSEQGQLQYMEYCNWNKLSVRKSVIEEHICRYNQKAQTATEREKEHHNSFEVYWNEDGLDEEQEQLFWELMASAIPHDFKADVLYAMVGEELEPYFQGLKSAQEVAKTLDSRVQIYLDEHK